MSCCVNWRDAIENMHNECLRKFLKKKKPVTAMKIAIKNKKYDCLPIFLEFGYQFPDNSIKEFIKEVRADLLELAYTHGVEMKEDDCFTACRFKQMTCLQYLHNRGCPWNSECLIVSAELHNFDQIKYLCENGCPISDDVMCRAVGESRIEYVDYFLEHGGSLSSTLYVWAKNLKMIKYLHSLNCPFSNGIPYNVKLNMLEYLYKNGLHWDEVICYSLARQKKVDCLKYAHINGCPIGERHKYKYMSEEVKKYVDLLFEKK